MVRRDANPDTVELLKECDAGCRMAIDSMEQIDKYVTDDQLRSVIRKYNGAHIKMEEDIHRMLNNIGEEEREPNPLAKASSWIQSEVRMLIDGDTHQAASILTDGCHMGIKELNQCKNTYKGADERSVRFLDKLCDIETKMTGELQRFL